MTGKMLNRIKKRFLKPYKKHKDTLAFIGFILSILSLILPFIIEERIVVIQRIREIELPVLNQYSVNPQETLTITASVYAIVERANGTIEILKTYP